MAIIGAQLISPEGGWKRFDNVDNNISYVGTGWFDDLTYTPSGGSRKSNTATTPECSIRFNFTGDKIRIIGILSSNWSQEVRITIDGIEELFSQYSPTVISQILNYEKLNLEYKEHSVVITNIKTGYWGMDAIDIDENGKLMPFIPSQSGFFLLRVTMLDSSEREYQLTEAEIDGFIDWFNTHTSTTASSYKLTKKIGIRSSKEYLVFNKIISFEVSEF